MVARSVPPATRARWSAQTTRPAGSCLPRTRQECQRNVDPYTIAKHACMEMRELPRLAARW